MTLTCSHGGVKVKMKCTLHIYIVPSVDWYHHWRNRSSSLGGEANTNYYPSAKIICDERTEGRTDGKDERTGRTNGRKDERTDTLITIWPPFVAIIITPYTMQKGLLYGFRNEMQESFPQIKLKFKDRRQYNSLFNLHRAKLKPDKTTSIQYILRPSEKYICIEFF